MMVEYLASHKLIFSSYLTLLWVSVGIVAYFVVVGFCAWIETRNTPKTDFFTCDRHGAFPVKLLMMIDLGDGRPPIKQCPFCYSDSFKTADARLKAEEAKRTAKPALTGKK
jgi:hypothetical protein